MSMNQQEQTRRMGRPAKSEGERKSEVLRFRVQEALKKQLEAASNISERTVTEEAEKRLQNSFILEPFHKIMFGSDSAKNFFLALINIVEVIQTHENPPGYQLGSEDWSQDYTRAALRAALEVLIDVMIPPPTDPETTVWSPAEKRHYAAGLDYMTEFGREYAEEYTGRNSTLTKLGMNAGGDAEH